MKLVGIYITLHYQILPKNTIDKFKVDIQFVIYKYSKGIEKSCKEIYPLTSPISIREPSSI